MLEGTYTERKEASMLLKEMVALHLIALSFITLKKNGHGRFDLEIKGDCTFPDLRDFIAERNLKIEEDTARGYCIISKP